MKNWFNNLDNKYKTLIHVVLGLIFFIMPSCIGDNTNTFIYLIWLTVMIFEIVFIVWHIQFYKSSKNININTESKETNASIKDEIFTKKIEEKKQSIKHIKIDSVNISELKVKVKPVSESKIDKYDLYGITPVSISSDFDNFTDNIYITTNVAVETKDGTDYKDIKLGAMPQKAIDELSTYLSHKFESKYVVIDADLDVDNSELIFSVPYDLEDDYLPIYSKIVGVAYENRQEYLKLVNADDLLILEHTPIEEHENCISVIHKTTNNVLGFIGRELADNLINRYGKGAKFYGLVTMRTGGGENKSIGCNIQIARVIK